MKNYLNDYNIRFKYFKIKVIIMYTKIYIIHLDAYPLTNRLINFANKYNFEIVPHITPSVYTTPCINEILTGKNINKNRLNGVFFDIKCSQFNKNYISSFELLLLNNWNFFVESNEYKVDTDGDGIFKGGIVDFFKTLNLYDTYFKPNIERFNINKNLLKKTNFNSKECVSLIQSIKKNSFCFFMRRNFHDVSFYNSLSKDLNEKKKTNLFEKALLDDFKCLENFDFNEENAIFYIYADHGYTAQRELNEPSDYITWTLIKDNTKKYTKNRLSYPLRTPSNMYNDILNILDIDDLDYDFSNLNNFNKDKIYFIEDSRFHVTPKHSDTAAALIVLEWSDNYPSKFLKLVYLRGNCDKDKRYILYEHIKDNWLDVETNYNTNILFKGYESDLKKLFINHKYYIIIRKLYIYLWENITSMFKLENKELDIELKEINKIRSNSKFTVPIIKNEKKVFLKSLNRYIMNPKLYFTNKYNWINESDNCGNKYKTAIYKCLNKLLTLNIPELNISFNYYIHPTTFINNYNSGLMKFIHVYKKYSNNKPIYILNDNYCNDIILHDNSWEYIVTCFVGNFKENLKKTNKKLKTDVIPKYTYNEIQGNKLYIYENINDYSCKIFDTMDIPNNFSKKIWKYKLSFISPK